jgi:hypothetical protein
MRLEDDVFLLFPVIGRVLQEPNTSIPAKNSIVSPRRTDLFSLGI